MAAIESRKPKKTVTKAQAAYAKMMENNPKIGFKKKTIAVVNAVNVVKAEPEVTKVEAKLPEKCQEEQKEEIKLIKVEEPAVKEEVQLIKIVETPEKQEELKTLPEKVHFNDIVDFSCPLCFNLMV